MRQTIGARLLVLLGSLALYNSSVAATPAVNVALRASFPSPPYLVELLETAADEDPSLYFPLLDRVAEGYFDDAKTDWELYSKFVNLFGISKDGLNAKPEALSSIQLALSIHNSAPRIEAQYQYYQTAVEPLLEQAGGQNCESWLLFAGKQYCSPTMEKEDATAEKLSTTSMPFDRVLAADSDDLPSILYADITSPSFRQFHETLKKTAKEGKTSYTVRYKPSSSNTPRPLGISGYGVQLNLKRTDYIVIDDRQGSDDETSTDDKAKDGSQVNSLEEGADQEIEDIQPLSASELEGLDLKVASYVAASENPLDTLLRITQDFPKHSKYLSTLDISDDFVTEANQRKQFLPGGYNVVWINGVQYDTRKMDPYSLLDYLRKERRLVGDIMKTGLTAEEAIKLMSNEAITQAQLSKEAGRYDWRDETEGGGVIIWLNDIEKDSRYAEWPEEIDALLQPSYPGSLPALRKDIHNAIFPADFSDFKQVAIVAENIKDLIGRKIPVRWGIVPLVHTDEAKNHAKIAYHILETYGLGTLMEWLKSVQKEKTRLPNIGAFQKIVEKKEPRKNREHKKFADVIADEVSNDKIVKTQKYLNRLGIESEIPTIFINGIPAKREDNWLQALSQRVGNDLRLIQRAVYDQVVKQEDSLSEYFIVNATLRRNSLVVPEDDKNVKLFSLASMWGSPEIRHNMAKMQTQIPVDKDSNKTEWTQVMLAANLDTDEGLDLLKEAIEFRKRHGNVNIVVHNTGDVGLESEVRSKKIVAWLPFGPEWDEKWLTMLQQDLEGLKTKDPNPPLGLWPNSTSLLRKFGFEPGQAGLIINGRKIGPIPSGTDFTVDDFEALYQYEYKKRIGPASSAMQALGIADKLNYVVDVAELCSMLAVSTVNDVPEGIFDTPNPVRTDLFDDWNTTHSAILTGDRAKSPIQVTATIDPISESAQKWIPVLKVLSELDGVHMRIFLNPNERLTELPIKRFYRYVLASAPEFGADGSLTAFSANFKGLPRKTLMTMGMDVAASWLVAPKESPYDLDNIKLSTVEKDTVVDATYELESILVEGHSRDVSKDMPPRGAQLVLSTAQDASFADTMVMANLGYFQFKANPGYYKINLKAGLTSSIFNIDSVGAQGYAPQPGDDVTDVTLMSFQGLTLFPRLSRKPGMEDEDVLAADDGKSTAENILAKGADAVDGLLAKAGLKEAGVGKFLSKALDGGQKIMSSVGVPGISKGTKHADINIFSVASGHLYERMLNIMMLSVMKNTKHTVKFWFIEQFLSPSFKSFLPVMAKEYGFEFEMVTYKWPHWLRTQKEKQREIWGYKILFLDVLFPLDLDKVIFVDADQIVRTDMYELVQHDLHGAPYGFTPMCDSRTSMEGYRFWKVGYWKNFLRGLPYHISALYVVDLKRFRELAAGDRLRQQYHQLSADPGSLSNLDQDLPNNMQMSIPIHSLPQDWLWCETWCSDEALSTAKTIDLCNNPETKEPKLDRARRQVPEWTRYDDEVAGLAKKTQGEGNSAVVGEGAGRVQEEDQIERDKPVSRQEVKEKAEDSPNAYEKVRDEL